jgi:vancomycin permeability regulator SanA
MISLIKKQIIEVSNINFSRDKLVDLQNRNVLDDELAFFAYFLGVISKLSFTFKASSSDWNELLQCAKKNIETQQEKILKFYEEFFPENVVVGQFQNDELPDVLIVLGANPPLLEQRIHYASELAKQYSEAMVVVSGGGFNVDETEAERMYKILLSKGVSSNRIIMEVDSMDTIGNALFSKLILKKQNMIKEGLRVLVVTSKFHAARSLNYFTRIFSPECRVAVSCIATLDKPDRIAYARHELLAEYQAQNSVFSFQTGESFELKNQQYGESNAKKEFALDDQTLLFQLLSKHELYKDRYDLWRKFFLLSSP